MRSLKIAAAFALSLNAANAAEFKSFKINDEAIETQMTDLCRASEAVNEGGETVAECMKTMSPDIFALGQMMDTCQPKEEALAGMTLSDQRKAFADAVECYTGFEQKNALTPYGRTATDLRISAETELRNRTVRLAVR